MPDFRTVCQVGDIPEGEARMFVVDSAMVGVFHIDGQFHALDNDCPHAGASLAHGLIEGDAVRCRIHHRRFCIRDSNSMFRMIPWELYETRSDAVSALTDTAVNVESLPPIVDCPLVQSEDVGEVTCVECGGRTWQQNAVEAQPQLESIGKLFGRRRIVIDFQDEPDWPIGTPFYACLYALYRGVAEQRGRFAVCGLVPELRDFFCGHQDPLAVPLIDGRGQFRCLVHDCEFEDLCPECQRRIATQ